MIFAGIVVRRNGLKLRFVYFLRIILFYGGFFYQLCLYPATFVSSILSFIIMYTYCAVLKRLMTPSDFHVSLHSIIIFATYIVHIICTYMLGHCFAFNSVCNSLFINRTNFSSSKVSWSSLFSLSQFCGNYQLKIERHWNRTRHR